MNTPSHRVMIVDRDTSFVNKAREAVASQGYEVEALAGVAAALSRMREMKCDCVIMAEELGDARGHDAVAIMKAVWPELPVIITADRNTPEQEAMIRREDVFFYYLKSFDIHELQMAVDDALMEQVQKTKTLACQRRVAP